MKSMSLATLLMTINVVQKIPLESPDANRGRRRGPGAKKRRVPGRGMATAE